MTNKNKKVLAALAILGLIAAFFALDGEALFDLERFQTMRAGLRAAVDDHFAVSALLYFLLFTALTALTLPVGIVLSVIGGALFGLWWGVVLASFASSIGATLSFLAARTFLRNWARTHLAHRLPAINRGLENDGLYYLFSLRLVPIVPFFLLNFAMALTRVSTRNYYIVSQLGMLPATFLFVNVGVRLGSATTLPGVFSAPVVLSVLALALLPWVGKALLAQQHRRRVYHGYARPRCFDANLVVIGAGVAGQRCARIGARLAARVVLIDQRKGADHPGDSGVARQALVRSARIRHLLGRARDFGVGANSGETDFRRVMERVRDVAAAAAEEEGLEQLARLGVECIQGEARLTSPWTVQVGGREIRTRAIVLATGARPRVPALAGLEEAGYVSADALSCLRRLPRRLLVLGGGPRGCELAQAFARLGAQVTLLESGPRLLPAEDADVADAVAQALEADGIRLLLGFRLGRVGRSGDVKVGFATRVERTVEIPFDELLLALGGEPDLRFLGLEALGMEEERSGLELDGFLATRFPNILACGDAAEPLGSVQDATFQAWYAAFNGLFEPFARLSLKRKPIPRAVCTDPEVVRVGLSEEEARARRLPFETFRYEMKDVARAMTDGDTGGFVKVLCAAGSDRILGAVVVAAGASDVIQPVVLAMTRGLGLDKLLAIHCVHPSRVEALRLVALERRGRGVPAWRHDLLLRFHRWRRGD